MLLRYIGLIFGFAFRRTTIAVDGLQILAASGLPAAAKFAGIKMPETASNDILAYIGLVAIAFVIIRLLCAPFFIWKDDQGTITQLRNQIERPKSLEMEKLAEIRAEKRLELAVQVREMHTQFLLPHVPPASPEQFNQIHETIVRLNAQLNLPKNIRATMAEINQFGRRRAVLFQQLSDKEFANASLYVIGVIDHLHTGLEP